MPLPLDRLKGSIPPIITPFHDGDVDYDAYARLVEFQIREGSHGVLVNGTTSEPAVLTTEERNRLVTLSIARRPRAACPIVAATGSQSMWETRILTHHAVTAGADALLIVTPYYTPPAAARHGRVLPRSHAGHRPAVDDLSHPRTHRGRRHARHRQGAARAVG